jgi:hypothetical protein
VDITPIGASAARRYRFDGIQAPALYLFFCDPVELILTTSNARRSRSAFACDQETIRDTLYRWRPQHEAFEDKAADQPNRVLAYWDEDSIV